MKTFSLGSHSNAGSSVKDGIYTLQSILIVIHDRDQKKRLLCSHLKSHTQGHTRENCTMDKGKWTPRPKPYQEAIYN